jgi:hypothetical protein
MWHHRFEEHTAFNLRVEMLVVSYQATRLYDPKGHSINLHCSDNSNVTHVLPVGFFQKRLPMQMLVLIRCDITDSMTFNMHARTNLFALPFS